MKKGIASLAAVATVWALLFGGYAAYLEFWTWRVGPFECGAKLMRLTRSPCMPPDKILN